MIPRLAALLIALAPLPAQAIITCSFNSTPGLAFGAYDDASATPTDSATSVVVRCLRVSGANNANVTLQLGPSAASGTIASRQLRSGANLMNYNLYRDAGRTQIWGQSSGIDTVTVTVTNVPNFGTRDATFTVYGRIPEQQNVPAGSYTDSVQITVSP